MTPEGKQLTEDIHRVFEHLLGQAGDPRLTAATERLARFLHGETGIDIPIGRRHAVGRITDDSGRGVPVYDREVVLARGLLALMRTHEDAGDPHTWTVDPAPWGDGRTTFEVHEYNGRTRGLVCQFRPDDIDGTEDLARSCVTAVQNGLDAARAVLAEIEGEATR